MYKCKCKCKYKMKEYLITADENHSTYRFIFESEFDVTTLQI